MTMHDELIAAIEDFNPLLQGAIDRQTPLISSGRLDSLSLLSLMTWIEGKTGRPVDIGTIDLAAEWDSIDAIVEFVERSRQRG